jgi:hypothetical protein
MTVVVTRGADCRRIRDVFGLIPPDRRKSRPRVLAESLRKNPDRNGNRQFFPRLPGPRVPRGVYPRGAQSADPGARPEGQASGRDPSLHRSEIWTQYQGLANDHRPAPRSDGPRPSPAFAGEAIEEAAAEYIHNLKSSKRREEDHPRPRHLQPIVADDGQQTTSARPARQCDLPDAPLAVPLICVPKPPTWLCRLARQPAKAAIPVWAPPRIRAWISAYPRRC